jgi:hypothetical protein
MVLHAELQAEVVEAEHDLIDTRHREDVSKAPAADAVSTKMMT